MHELSIVTEVYAACRRELAARGGERLEQARLAVGELSAVEPELLAYAWEALLATTPDAGAALEIEWRPVRQLCDACGEIAGRAPGSWMRLCPRCGGPLRLEGGQELDLLSLTFTPAAAETRKDA